MQCMRSCWSDLVGVGRGREAARSRQSAELDGIHVGGRIIRALTPWHPDRRYRFDSGMSAPEVVVKIDVPLES